MKHKYTIRQKVIILKSSFSGINVGDIGTIHSYENLGYGVYFNKTWPVTFINEKPPTEGRVYFFEEKDLKPA